MAIERMLGMPTASRLVAAICVSFSLLAMVYVIINYFPEERYERFETRLLWTFGLFGVFHGWWGLGPKALKEEGSGFLLGLRSAISCTVSLVFICAIADVIDQIIDSRLAGARPMQAIVNMFQSAMEIFGLLLTQPKVIFIFAVMGIVCGVLTRRAAKRWD